MKIPFPSYSNLFTPFESVYACVLLLCGEYIMQTHRQNLLGYGRPLPPSSSHYYYDYYMTNTDFYFFFCYEFGIFYNSIIIIITIIRMICIIIIIIIRWALCIWMRTSQNSSSRSSGSIDTYHA